MMAMPSCVGDLDMKPNDPNSKTELNSAAEYEGFFYQLYNGLVVSGPQGGSDITVDDGGAGTYMRQLWNLEELPTDEALIGKNWNDAGIDELDFSTWSPDNHWLYEAMSRFSFQINMCNEFIRTIDKAAGMISDDEIAAMKREAIVLRALSYYHLMDNFGKVPFTDENSTVGATPPTLTRAEMFERIVPQLAETVKDLTPASAQKYGRLSREAGYMLLAKFYLNAEVYTGTARWQDCANACNEILKTINTLAPEYKYLFCATNDKYVGNGEILWALPQDENNQQTYGGTTYLSIGAYNANVVATAQGLQGTGWGGPRIRPELAEMFESLSARIWQRTMCIRHVSTVCALASLPDSRSTLWRESILLTAVWFKTADRWDMCRLDNFRGNLRMLATTRLSDRFQSRSEQTMAGIL